MAIIRPRKKQMFLHAGIGFAIGAVPLCIFCFLLLWQCKKSAGELEACRDTLDQMRSAQAYVLKRDLKEGEVIDRGCLEETYFSIEDKSGYRPLIWQDIVGKRSKLNLSQGTILDSSMLYEGEEIHQDLRVAELTMLQLPVGLKKDDYIDIRIVFPSGEDYIVAKHKKVLDMLSGEEGGTETAGIRLYVSEEEILRIASANVDCVLYRDTALYAIRYVNEAQSGATVNYPVNPQVFALMQWDPNLFSHVVAPQEQGRRQQLSDNLSGYIKESVSGLNFQQASETMEFYE